MPARYLYCTAPDGTILRRRTDRDYSHAILVRLPNVGWGIARCAGRIDLAHQAMSQVRRRFKSDDTWLAEVRRYA